MNRTDFGPTPCVANVEQMAEENGNFRMAIWTGCHVQMTLMCISPCDEIGEEVHPDTDQIIRVEKGKALVKMGKCQCMLGCQQCLKEGDVVFIPAGIWHNIINTEDCALKLSSIYAPPHHPKGTIHRTKADAEE